MPVRDLMAECARLAGGGGAGALASVARRRGSLPMSGTAKMLISAGGARLGTVGGGCLEAEIVERALDVAERRVPAVSEHSLNSELAGDYGLTCGGTVMMLIEPVYADALLERVYSGCASLLARGGRGTLVTGSDWGAGPAKLLIHDGGSVGSDDASLVDAAASFDDARELPELAGGVLAERIAGAPRLVVFGGGHVGARVGEAASFAGWRVTVVDDRPEYADSARLAFAERTVVCDFADLPATLVVDAATYVVVCTRGHQHDAAIVDQLARLDARYVGMLGSRRKVELTWQLLERAGIDRARLERIHAPVGLSIGADTPEEIAISVVAEMIAVRRAGTSRRGGASAAMSFSDAAPSRTPRDP